jgi:hypothetical protein
MSSLATLILALYIVAFLVFVVRFYVRDGANSITAPSFLMALATVAVAVLYLCLGIFWGLPPFAPLVFGLIGAGLLGFGVFRSFRL